MSFPAGQRPRRAKLTWVEWLGQSFSEDPDEWDDEGYCGDQEEPADAYDLGCLLLAAIIAVCSVATLVLLILAAT